MGNRYSAKEVEEAENVGDIISATQAEIEHLKSFLTNRDVDVVRRATKGFGTDEASLINTLCNRTEKQLEAIDLLYHSKYESSLLAVVEEEVSGNFGKMVTYSLMSVEDFGAMIFTRATKGLGTKEHILIDFVLTHSNEQIADIKEAWEAKNNASMLDCVNSEFGGNARKIMVALIMGHKSESKEVDEGLAEEQAAALHDAGVQKLLGTDDDVFVDIIAKESRAQIQAIKAAYENNFGMSLMRAVNKETSGTYRKVLLGCLFPSPEAYTAYALFKAFEGFGTDEDRVCRLLGGTDKRKTRAVADTYLETYGTSLVESLKDELSGTFLKATLAWVMGADPTKGMEYVTEKALEELDESNEREVSKALLQERANLLDFICQADAGDIRASSTGLGTDDKLMSSIICGRTKPHLARVNMYYHSMYNMSLERQVKKETSGAYEDFLVYTLLPEEDFDALMLKQAMDGIGVDKSLIISILAPLSNERILAARTRHDEKYGVSLLDRLKSELSGDTETGVLALIRGERDEELVDEDLAADQAKKLHKAGVGRFGTDEDTFIRILTKSSREQIKLIRQCYEENHGMSLERAIKKETSGSFEKLLLALTMEPIAYYAHQLKQAFKGILTDKHTVIRVLGGNDKGKVDEIADYYLDAYGESLVEAIKRETGGRLRRALLTWISTSDPINAGDKLQDALCDLGDEEPEGEDNYTSRGLPPDVEEEEKAPEVAPPSYEESAAQEGAGGYGGGEYVQYYQPPPPPQVVFYTSAPVMVPTYSMGLAGQTMAYGAPPPHQSRGGPPPPEDDDDDDDDDDDEEDEMEGILENATEEQLLKLKRLMRKRSRAAMSGDPGKARRIQNRIDYLKWEIQNQG